MPLFRVVIPTFNRAALLREALTSVLAQTFADFEVIVVNDGSTDGTAEVLYEFAMKDWRIRHLLQANGGPARARNLAIKQAGDYEYIAFLDSDDRWLPEHLQQAVTMLEQVPQADMLFSRFEIPAGLQGHWTEAAILANTRSLEKVLRRGTPAHNGYFLAPEVCVRGLLYSELAPHPSTVVIRRAAVAEPEWFNPALPVMEDLEFFLRLAAAGQGFFFMDSITTEVRYYGDNITGERDLKSPTILAKQRSVLQYYKSKKSFCRSAEDTRYVVGEIADTAWLLGQCYAEQGNILLARAAYWEALSHKVSLPVVKSLIGSLLPRRLYAWIHAYS